MRKIATPLLASVTLLLTILFSYNGFAQTKVVLAGTFQDELGCPGEWQAGCDATALTYDVTTKIWSGTFAIDAGYWQYKVAYNGEWKESYGEDGGPDNIWLYVPVKSNITFVYNPLSHRVTSTPYSGVPAKDVQLFGEFQSELGCLNDWLWECSSSRLSYNTQSNKWEGTFTLPAGCYKYQMKVTPEYGKIRLYGESGSDTGKILQLYVPQTGDVTFSYDASTHLVTTTPYGPPLPGVRKVSLYGTLQGEIGCRSDWEYFCDNAGLAYNASSGKWEGKFNLPAGCYYYQVKEEFGCDMNNVFYGEGGLRDGPYIQLSVPVAAEISFVYDPISHLISSSPYSGASIASVSLLGDFQSELNCNNDWMMECPGSRLVYNKESDSWIGTFTLPAGCYRYVVVESSGCITGYYGQGGAQDGPPIELYLPVQSEVTFTYTTAKHIMNTSPFGAAPQAVTKVSLYGKIQEVFGCGYNSYNCDKPALSYNSVTGRWEGKFNLPTGCYSYLVKETFGCNNEAYYGENGQAWGNYIQLYVPESGEVSFSYNPKDRTISSSPYDGAPQELLRVSLYGTLQSELGCNGDYSFDCGNPALSYDATSGKWIGKYTLPAGCYSYLVQETVGCNSIIPYGENGLPGGNFIQFYVPERAEVTFVYNAKEHTISTAPYGAPPAVVTKVSLWGDLQSETGCSYDFNDYCDNAALTYNAATGKWEGAFTLPPGCYFYHVKETIGCNKIISYGQNGQSGGLPLQLSVTKTTKVTFIYDAATHMITTTPGGGGGLGEVSLIGNLQTSLGCPANWDAWNCNNAVLTYNEASGLWEGTFSLKAGCYRYAVKEVRSCNYGFDIYGQNGSLGAHEYYNYYLLYVPEKTEVTISYNPVTHLASSEYHNICPSTTVVLAGTFQSELGCQPVTAPLGGDWEPGCDATRLTWDAKKKVWTGTFDIPAGPHEFKIVHDNSWNESYGQKGSPEAFNNIPLPLEAPANITFIYNPVTHLVDLVYNTLDLCVKAYYDANGNGVKDTTENIPMAGVAISLSNGVTQYTGSDGVTCFTKLPRGVYTLMTTVPDGYLPTLAPQTIELLKPRAISFGVAACLGGAGAQNLSFWMTKHGQGVFDKLPAGKQEEVLAKLRAFNLRTADGSQFDPWSYEQLKAWLQKANAKNMAYKLSAEMAVLYLNAEIGKLGSRTIYTPGINYWGDRCDFMYVYTVIWYVDQQLLENSYGGDASRAQHESLRKMLEDANADKTYVQLQPCGSDMVTSAKKGVLQEGASVKLSAVIWPNPSGAYFNLRPGGLEGEVQVRVMDVHGKLLYSARGSAQKEHRFGDGFKAGLYFVEITQGSNRSTIKVIKQ